MSSDKKPGTPKDSHYARLRRTHREQAGGAPQFRPKKPVPPGAEPSDGLIRLYGLHTVRAALDNPKRKIRRMLVTRNALERLGIAGHWRPALRRSIVDPRTSTKSPAARRSTKVRLSKQSR